jgi:hypothetical protein
MAVRPFRIPVDIGAGGWKGAELRIPRNLDLTVNVVAPHPERATGAVNVRVGTFRGEGGQLFTASTAPFCQIGQDCFLRDLPPGEWTLNFQALGLKETGAPPHKL